MINEQTVHSWFNTRQCTAYQCVSVLWGERAKKTSALLVRRRTDGKTCDVDIDAILSYI